MQKQVLIVVDGDPRTSHRPAEALRVAAGLATWLGHAVTVCLTGPAAELLRPGMDFVGEEDLQLAWPLLREVGAIICTGPAPIDLAPGSNEALRLDGPAFARLCAQADYSLRF